MQVNKASFEARVHTLYSELVHKEMDGFRCTSVKALVRTPIYAVSVRVTALFCHAYWVTYHVVHFFPKMIGIGIGLAVARPVGLPFYQRAAHVYTLYFKTIAATFVLGSLACVIPEITHYSLELHKSLFSLQLKAFVETLPILPHVSKSVKVNHTDSLALLYSRLHLSDAMFKNDLLYNIKAAYELDPKLASNLVTTDSKEFQDLFKQTLIRLTAAKLNQLQEQNRLSSKMIEGLNSFDLWKAMMARLDPRTRLQVIELLAQCIPNPEGNKEFTTLYSLYTGFTYRDPKSVSVLRQLVTHMIEARDALLEAKKFTKSEVADFYTALNPITLLGILRLLDSASLAGKNIRLGDALFTKDYHFFEQKGNLVLLKEKLLVLTHGQRDELNARCSTDDYIELGAPAKECYNLLWKLKSQIDQKTHNRGLNEASSVNFMEVFAIDVDDEEEVKAAN